MLLIAVSFGFEGDPYTCSCTVEEENFNPQDASACRDYIANEQELPVSSIDEVLVIYSGEVQHHHTGSSF